MVYVMSDIHGQYEKYVEMLKKIEFKESDELYILGDVVDRGDGSIKILKDMSMRTNVYPILGNHDLTAAIILKKLCAEITAENFETHLNEDFLDMYSMWLFDGGKETLDEFKNLPIEDKEWVIEYLEEFTPYEQIEVNGNKFLLVHGGIPFEKKNIELSKQSVYQLIIERPDYSHRYYINTYLVTGHTPTLNISEEYTGKIYRKNGHIAIDCGAGYGLPLGCIRLNDFKEFYIE